jgi:hypothetical protein
MKLRVFFLLTLTRSTLRLLLLEQQTIQFALVANSKLIYLVLPGRLSSLFGRQNSAVIDFADLPSDSEQSGDSDSIPSCEPELLNWLGLATLKIESQCVCQWFCITSMVLLQRLVLGLVAICAMDSGSSIFLFIVSLCNS